MDGFSKYKKTLLAFGIALTTLSFILVLNKTLEDVPYDQVSLWIDNEKVLVLELVNTPESRQLGLSGRELLELGSGMLFFFDMSDKHGIWMKDMNFAIDIVWIDENYKIVDIKKNARPESFPEVFVPKTSSKYVLEVNTGFLEKNDIEIGERIFF